MQSSISVLSFYFDMLFVNNIDTVKNSFKGSSTLYNYGYRYIQEYDYYKKDEMVEDDGKMPVFVTEFISRLDFFERLLSFENISIYKTIESEISTRETEQDKTTYITKIYDDIQVLLKRVLKLEDDEVRLIEDKLIEVINNLKDRYQSIAEYHNVFGYLIKETDNTFFKNRISKYSFYKDLYEVSYSLDLIDDVEIEEHSFIEVFISPKPQILEKKIRFTKNNYVIAYFMESLKPFFSDFTYVAIEKSLGFLNKQNKPLKSTDISASLSRGKNKIEYDKLKIDTQILILKDEYLK